MFRAVLPLSGLSSNTIAYISRLSVDGSILVASAALGFLIFTLYCHFKVILGGAEASTSDCPLS